MGGLGGRKQRTNRLDRQLCAGRLGTAGRCGGGCGSAGLRGGVGGDRRGAAEVRRGGPA